MSRLSRARAILFAALFLIDIASPASAGRPNVLLLYADDWRHDTLGCAGDPLVLTPTLDRLAAEGVRFTDARVTTSICGVSRASLLTGQWMSRHGCTAFGPFRTPWGQTLPGVLREAGYHVGHVGKWHNGRFPARHYDFGRTYKNRHYLRLADGETIHVTDRNENDAIDFLNTRPADKPFFLTIAFFAPHAEDGHTDQYLYQPETAHLYERQAVPVSPIATPGAFENLPPFLQSERNYGRLRWHWRFDTPEKYQRYAKAYLRLVTGVDAACGRILKRLDELGLADDTLVIFTTDNGYFLGERELADKWYPYEQSIRVPLIVRDPRATRRGVTVDEFVLNVDLAPTILSAAGLDVPAGMQGRSFETLYLDRQAADPWDRAPWRTEFFYEHGTIRDRWSIPSSQAVVRKDAKYIEWPEFEYAELYDLTADPLEQRNLVDAAGHADLREELRLRLERLRQGAR